MSEQIRFHGVMEGVKMAQSKGQATLTVQKPSKAVVQRLTDAGLELQPAPTRNGRERMQIIVPKPEPVVDLDPVEPTIP